MGQLLIAKNGKKYHYVKCPTDSRFKQEKKGKCKWVYHDAFDNPVTDVRLTLNYSNEYEGMYIDEKWARCYMCNDCMCNDCEMISCD